MVRFPWQRGAPSSLSVQTESFFRVAGGGGSCDFAKPCLNSMPMLCGVHNYWRPCVTIWGLLRAATSVSSNKMACGRKEAVLPELTDKVISDEILNAQQELAHRQTLTIWDPLFDVNYFLDNLNFIYSCLFSNVSFCPRQPGDINNIIATLWSVYHLCNTFLTIWKFYNVVLLTAHT